jgi:hypothetical protein
MSVALEWSGGVKYEIYCCVGYRSAWRTYLPLVSVESCALIWSVANCHLPLRSLGAQARASVVRIPPRSFCAVISFGSNWREQASLVSVHARRGVNSALSLAVQPATTVVLARPRCSRINIGKGALRTVSLANSYRSSWCEAANFASVSA